MSTLWFWNCGGETGHLIRADKYDDAVEAAIQARMKWTGEDREICKGWFNKNDQIYEVTNGIQEVIYANGLIPSPITWNRD